MGISIFNYFKPPKVICHLSYTGSLVWQLHTTVTNKFLCSVQKYFACRPQEIDEAARRRFVKRLYIPLPEAAARKQIVLNLMSQQLHSLTDDEVESICVKSEGNLNYRIIRLRNV